MRPTRVTAAAAVLFRVRRPARSRHAAYAAGPGDTVVMPVRDALAALPVRDEARAGYERSKFRHWIDADRDGCNTRAEVLLEEAVTAPEQGSAVG